MIERAASMCWFDDEFLPDLVKVGAAFSEDSDVARIAVKGAIAMLQDEPDRCIQCQLTYQTT
jgi:hypothetical protein